MKDTERGRDTGRGRSRLPHGKPDARLDPRTPGSHPEPKADAQVLSHRGLPSLVLAKNPAKPVSQEPPTFHGQSGPFLLLMLPSSAVRCPLATVPTCHCLTLPGVKPALPSTAIVFNKVCLAGSLGGTAV